MPVQKFRSIEEMNAAPLRVSAESDFDRFLRHCARYWKIAPRVYPRGVWKFRSIADARHPPSSGARQGSEKHDEIRPLTVGQAEWPDERVE